MSRESVGLEHVLCTVRHFITTIRRIPSDQTEQGRYNARLALMRDTLTAFEATPIAAAVRECREAGYSPKEFDDAYDQLRQTLQEHCFRLVPLPQLTDDERQTVEGYEAEAMSVADDRVFLPHRRRYLALKDKDANFEDYFNRQQVAFDLLEGPSRALTRMRAAYEGLPDPVAAPMPTVRQPDGPYAEGCFRIGMADATGIGLLQWKLLRSLWDAAANGPAGPRDMKDVWRELYGRNERFNRQRLMTLKNDTNATLLGQHVPATVDPSTPRRATSLALRRTGGIKDEQR